MTGMTINHYVPPGPVAAQLLMDRTNSVRGIMGPFGSGKTNLLFYDALKSANEMPKCRDGNRRYRHITLRDTYQNLWGTTIKSWWRWFPSDVGQWTGGEGRRATHELRFDMPDGGLLIFEHVFQAIQDGDVENALRGIEFTSATMGEADLMNGDILTYLLGRAIQQRYPAKSTLPAGTNYYTSVTLDLNPPDMDNWLYVLFEELRPAGHKLYRQPSGRSPLGENRAAIGREIYEKMATENAHRQWWVRRMVDGQWGFSREGEPVYTEYDDTVHCAEKPIAPIPGIPLRLGFDQGVRGPAMIVAQWTPKGQLLVLDELCPGRIGPSGFGRECKLMLEGGKYRGFRVERATGDPAGFFGGDTETGDHSMFQTVMEVMDITIWPAESQELDIRQDGVRQLLRYRIDGREPAILLSPTAKTVRKGFNSHYRYRKRRGSETATDPVPEKNEYSNPHDALQYLVEDLVGVEGIKRGELMGGRGDRVSWRSDDEDDDRGGTAMPKTDFDVWKS